MFRYADEVWKWEVSIAEIILFWACFLGVSSSGKPPHDIHIYMYISLVLYSKISIPGEYP